MKKYTLFQPITLWFVGATVLFTPLAAKALMEDAINPRQINEERAIDTASIFNDKSTASLLLSSKTKLNHLILEGDTSSTKVISTLPTLVNTQNNLKYTADSREIKANSPNIQTSNVILVLLFVLLLLWLIIEGSHITSNSSSRKKRKKSDSGSSYYYSNLDSSSSDSSYFSSSNDCGDSSAGSDSCDAGGNF